MNGNERTHLIEQVVHSRENGNAMLASGIGSALVAAAAEITEVLQPNNMSEQIVNIGLAGTIIFGANAGYEYCKAAYIRHQLKQDGRATLKSNQLSGDTHVAKGPSVI